jgi:mono/diheme cytochrome c family protein
MARVAAVLVCFAVLVLVALGCGGSEETTPTPETVEGTVPTETGGGGGGGTAEGDPEAGKEVFASAGCGSCHVFADAGSSGTVGPDLDSSTVDFDAAVQQITNGGGGMPPFSGELSEEEIANVAAYVVTARS